MGDFQRGGNRGGGFRGGNSGGRQSFGGNRGGDRGPVTMHKAICDECQKSCEVPFRPSGDKPIFCNECFSNKKGGDSRGQKKDFGGDRAPRREFNDKPSFSKPVSAPMSDETKKLLSEMNSKLDRLASAIEKLSQPKVDMTAHAGVKSAPVVAKKSPAVKAVTKKVASKPKKVSTKKKTK